VVIAPGSFMNNW